MESVFIGFYSPIVLHFAFQDQVEDKSRENGFAQVEEENYNLEGPVGPSIPDHTHSFPKHVSPHFTMGDDWAGRGTMANQVGVGRVGRSGAGSLIARHRSSTAANCSPAQLYSDSLHCVVEPGNRISDMGAGWATAG